MISVRTKTVARAPTAKNIFFAACFRSIMVPLNTPALVSYESNSSQNEKEFTAKAPRTQRKSLTHGVKPKNLQHFFA
jgi:hypothetical protein